MKKGYSVSKRLGWTGALFILPVLLYFIFLYWYPLFQAFEMSFKEVLPKMRMRFVGLKTYSEVFAEPLFWSSFLNTVLFTLISVIFTVLLALVVSISLNNLRRPGARNVLTMFYIAPTLISLAAAALIWDWIYQPLYGLANQVFSVFGNPRMFLYLTSETQVVPSLAVINIWVRMGFSVLILLSGLQGIPASYFDAAMVDGAKGLKLYWHITLPLLLPQIVVVTLLEVIFGLKVFDLVYVTTKGGPNMASHTLMLYLYNNAFRHYRPDKGAVTAVFTFVVLLAFSIVQRKLVAGRRYEL